MNIQRDGQTPSASVHISRGAFVTVEVAVDDHEPAARIAADLGDVPIAQIFLFCSPSSAFETLVSDLDARLPDVPVVACTTAGEIGAQGYADDRIIAVALPKAHFATQPILIETLSGIDRTAAAERVVAERIALADANPDKPEGFAFLMVDGLSLREDMLVGSLAPALGQMPLFGGSAGDGQRFDRTLLSIDGRVYRDAAILTLVQTDHAVKVFSLDNLVPTDTRMVVTAADPDRRIVKEINAEPAGREYARIIGKDPEQLDEFTFASHPVTVRLGEGHHVRAIQRVNETGELVFFSAIEEGMVLTVAEPAEIVNHLEQSLARLSATASPAGILACDCLLRRISAEQGQRGREISEVLSRHGVIGFSTYGEQIGPLHQNQTMTGVALFPPTGNGGA